MTIPVSQWLLWLILTVLLYVALFILVPGRLIKSFLIFGIVFGAGQAILVIWVFQFVLNTWRLVGDPVLFGMTTLFTPIAWIPPTIIYAAYFPKDRRWYYVLGYIFLFAGVSIVVQILLEQIGLWQDIGWNPLFTGLLAVSTHTVMAIYLVFTKARIRT